MKTKRILAMLAAFILVASFCTSAFADFTLQDKDPADAPWADYYANQTDINEILSNVKGIRAPQEKYILSEYKPMYVVTDYAYLCYMFSTASAAARIGSVKEAEYVLVLAEKNGWSLVCVDKSTVGWVASRFLHEGYYSGPNPSDTTNLEKDVNRPTKNQYIDEYETKIVRTRFGIRAPIMKKPYEGLAEENLLTYVAEGAQVTVLAVHGSRSFIQMENGRKGWIISSLLADN